MKLVLPVEMVALDGGRLYPFEAIGQSELRECIHTPRLEQLAHDAVRFSEVSLQQEHLSSLAGKCNCGCASSNSGANNDDVVLEA